MSRLGLVGRYIIIMAVSTVAVAFLAHDAMMGGGQWFSSDLRLTGSIAVLTVQLLALPLMFQTERELKRQTSEIEQHASDFEHMATHDMLTELPNRALYQQRVDDSLARGQATGRSPALAILDLDGFKSINDTLGHETGDHVLQQVAHRLEAVMRPRDTLARFGGDEFVILLEDVRTPEEATATVKRLLTCLDDPVEADELVLVIEATAGVTLADGEDVGREELMRRADVALYQAKADRRRVELYRPEHDQAVKEQLTVLADLRDAITSGDMRLAYQPIVHARTGRILGFEALLRWDHPTHGPIPPGTFVPAAERSGLILDLTGFVLRQGLRDLKTTGLGDGGRFLSVNISTRDLVNDDLVQFVRSQLSELDLPGSALHVEVTETAAMADPERAARILTALADLGVEVAVDDYGTGHSSLSYLQRLPITTLKIDRSFVSKMTSDDGALTIVRSTIELAHNLGIRAIAEGVEEVAEMRLLGQLGCDMVQGYLTGRPGPIEQVTQLDVVDLRLT